MKICFVSLALYNCLHDQNPANQIGGAEIQQAQIARLLVEKGIQASVVTGDFGQEEGIELNGIKVHKTYRSGSGLPLIRFIYPNLFSIYKGLSSADADIYYVRTASYLTFVVSSFCKRNKKKWVYAGAHDTDFIPGEELIPNRRDRWLYQKGLAMADRIIVQSNMQKELLRKHYGKEGTIIRNFIDKEPISISQAGRQPIVLWVSTIRRWKRPEFFLDIARALPQYRFVMVGGKDALDVDFYGFIEQKANKLKNLEFKGFLPFQETEKLFDQATLLVNTSVKEGFPNTFLQAWRRGIPVMTWFDPDGVVSANGLGVTVNSVDDAVRVLPELLSFGSFNKPNIQKYFKNNHSTDVIEKYISLFEELL